MGRTFASLLYALGEASPYVMRQMGHTSPHLALAVHAGTWTAVTVSRSGSGRLWTVAVGR